MKERRAEFQWWPPTWQITITTISIVTGTVTFYHEFVLPRLVQINDNSRDVRFVEADIRDIQGSLDLYNWWIPRARERFDKLQKATERNARILCAAHPEHCEGKEDDD